MIQRTLILLKPDAVSRGIVGEILSRFEKVGAAMVGMKLLTSEKDAALAHYTEDIAIRRGEKVRKMLIEMITNGPIVAIVFEGVEMIEVARKMVGATEPKAALPGTIRGDYAHISYQHADEKGSAIFNLVHASSSLEEAEAEIAVWFKPEELIEDTNRLDSHLIR